MSTLLEMQFQAEEEKTKDFLSKLNKFKKVWNILMISIANEGVKRNQIQKHTASLASGMDKAIPAFSKSRKIILAWSGLKIINDRIDNTSKLHQ